MDYRNNKIQSIEDFRRLYEQDACGHFFSEDTMRFWGSKVLSDSFATDESCYFLTSEKKSFNDNTRAYSIRRGFVGESGKLSIETVEFQCSSLSDAKRNLSSMEKMHNSALNSIVGLAKGLL